MRTETVYDRISVQEEEEYGLLERLKIRFPQTKWTRKIKTMWSSDHPVYIFIFLFYSTLILFYMVWTTWSGFSFPVSVPDQQDSSNVPEEFSVNNAWSHLEVIGKETHMYNSIANKQVRKYLVDILSDLQVECQRKMNCSMIIENNDKINVTTTFLTDDPFSSSQVWHESDNILVRLRGSKQIDRSPNPNNSKALLISSHFDSVSSSHGVTDAGISIAVMLETIRCMIHSTEPLQRDIIFAFTNAEEMYLLGSSAFLIHPWMKKDIGAFINLEGTGSAMNTRNILFRTNSWLLTKAYAIDGQMYPHASIIWNSLVRLVRSETDFRRYALKIPGLDITYYSYRYLYHTRHDDLQHATKQSVQYAGLNLVRLVQQVSIGLTIENAFRDYHPLKSQEAPIPLADYVYHDVLGSFMVLISHRVYLALTFSVVSIVPAAFLMFLVYAYIRANSFIQFLTSTILPLTYLGSYLFSSMIVTFILATIISFTKSFINPASSYGQPEWNLVWMIGCVFLAFGLTKYYFPKYARCLVILRLLKDNNCLSFKPLLDSESRNNPKVTFSIYTSQVHFTNEENGDTSVDERRRLLIPEAVSENDGSFASFSASVDSDNRNTELFEYLEENYDDCIVSRENLVAEQYTLTDIIFHKYMHYSIITFWYLLSVVSMLMAWKYGNDAGYLLMYFAAFALASIAPKLLVEAIANMYTEPDDVLIISALPERMFLRSIHFMYRYQDEIMLLLSSTIPLILSLDVLGSFLIAVPSLIAENMSEYQHDLFFTTFLYLMIVNSLLVLKRVSPLTMMMVGSIFILIGMIPSMFLFPFRLDRPHKFDMKHIVDITDNEMFNASSMITLHAHPTATTHQTFLWLAEVVPIGKQTTHCASQDEICILDNVGLPSIDNKWPELNIHTKVSNTSSIYGYVLGSSHSRICRLSTAWDSSTITHMKNTNNKKLHRIHLTLEPQSSNDWQPMPFGDQSHFVNTASMIRRDFNLLTTSQISFEFKIDIIDPNNYSTLQKETRAINEDDFLKLRLNLTCFHDENETSGFFRDTLTRLNQNSSRHSWMTFVGSKYGNVEIQKSILISI